MSEEAEVIEPIEVEETEVEQESAQEGSDVSEGAPEDMGLVVEIGGDEVSDEPEHITELRRRYREQQKRLKELEAKASSNAPAATALPPKPTLEDCDYDAEAFEQKLATWYDAKREHDAREADVKAVQERAEQKWQSRLAFYDEGKSKLGAQDYDEAEATVAEILSAPFPGIMAEDVRIGIIKQGATDPAALVYALGKNPAKAKELAAIDDPVEFAWKAARLEASMKVVRGKAPPPEKRVSGGVAGVSGALDDTLERLRADAAKTGDFSKVMAYKRQHRG
jgi:hypothetical protein